jgi:hypothetical protein
MPAAGDALVEDAAYCSLRVDDLGRRSDPESIRKVAMP